MLLKIGFIVLGLVILYVTIQVILYKRDMKKTKEDLLKFVEKTKRTYLSRLLKMNMLC